jgi:hypothetical protein
MDAKRLRIHPSLPSATQSPVDDVPQFGGESEETTRSLSELDTDLLAYHTICVHKGFDSRQAAEFLRTHTDPEFLRLARGLNRLIMKAFLDKSNDDGQSIG